MTDPSSSRARPAPSLASLASLVPAAALGALLALPAIAGAQAPVGGYASTLKTVHLRAGPGRQYPAVAVLGTGTTVAVSGCLADWTWCDVSLDGVHGWVWAGNLGYPWEGAPVPIRDYGPRLGLVVVPFVLVDYWALWYPDRPWYRDRWRYVHPHPHPLPPPPPRPPRPPGPVPPPIHPKPPPWRPAPMPPAPPPGAQPAPPHAVTPLPRRRPDPATPPPAPQPPPSSR